MDDRFRGEQRPQGDIRPSGYRDRNEKNDKNERNERIERGERIDRGRLLSPAQRQERERFDRRPQDKPQDNEFRRDRRDDGNHPEWRGRGGPPQGKYETPFDQINTEILICNGHR